MFGSFKVVQRYLGLDVKVNTLVGKVARPEQMVTKGDGKVNELSYGNLEGTDQGNVKLLFEDNVQRTAAGVIERGDCIK